MYCQWVGHIVIVWCMITDREEQGTDRPQEEGIAQSPREAPHEVPQGQDQEEGTGTR